MSAHTVLATALSWRCKGYRCALVTVLSTFGGGPRPPGSMALVREDGVVHGSVSGGCVEADLAHELTGPGAFTREPGVWIRTFGASAEERARYRLPCNNTIRVAVEIGWDQAVVRDAVACLARGERIRRVVEFGGTRSRLAAADGPARFEEDERGFSVPLGPRHEALVIGSNDIGCHLTQLLSTLDFDVRVCDPRPEYGEDWPFADLVLSRQMPDDWIRAQGMHANTAVLAVSHDPKIDDLALLEALPSAAFYVGAIGSEAASARRRERLLCMGLEPAQIARLKGPVGLAIGSRTPAEISVSIAADLIRHLRMAPGLKP